MVCLISSSNFWWSDEMNSHTFTRMVILCGALVASHGFAQTQYTEEQKKVTVGRLASEISANQQKQINNMDNYNKNIFKATQSLYGGYKGVNVNVPNYENDQSLSEAQRNSIKNHQERAILIKKLVEGDL